MRTTVLFVCNNPDFFASQHMHLAQTARERGYHVMVATPAFAGVDRIEAEGFEHLIVPIARGGLNPLRDVAAIRHLRRLYAQVRPDLVYHITLKPILYGTIAARLAGVPSVVNANTGLGYAFIDGSWKTRVVRGLFERIYRRAIRHKNRFDLFLNHDDHGRFLRAGLANPARSTVVTGPGVDIDAFVPAPELGATPLVVLPARLLWHKGLAEFVEAARLVKRRGIDARFALVGDVDPGNPATVKREQLRAWDREGVVEWWGYATDMPAVYRRAHVVVLPSYREGLGKVLAEAGATARPVVATDVPGCREIVRHGVNGLLVPVRDGRALADAIATLVADAALRARLGLQGREEVETRFSETLIADQTMAIMASLLPDRRGPAPAPIPARERSAARPLPTPAPVPAREREGARVVRAPSTASDHTAAAS